jgi:hypothetical protein
MGSRKKMRDFFQGQAIPQIDTELSGNSHLWMETS